MAKLIGNMVILISGGILLLGAAIAVSIIFIYACGVVLVRRINGRQGRPQLPASV